MGGTGGCRTPLTPRGSRTAVYGGQVWAHYGDLLAQDNNPDPYTMMGSWVRGMLSGRLSYVLDLRGASLTLDSGCSSGLTTTHLATHALRSGEADLALVVGAQIFSTTASTRPSPGSVPCRRMPSRDSPTHPPTASVEVKAVPSSSSNPARQPSTTVIASTRSFRAAASTMTAKPAAHSWLCN